MIINVDGQTLQKVNILFLQTGGSPDYAKDRANASGQEETQAKDQGPGPHKIPLRLVQ